MLNMLALTIALGYVKVIAAAGPCDYMAPGAYNQLGGGKPCQNLPTMPLYGNGNNMSCGPNGGTECIQMVTQSCTLNPQEIFVPSAPPQGMFDQSNNGPQSCGPSNGGQNYQQPCGPSNGMGYPQGGQGYQQPCGPNGQGGSEMNYPQACLPSNGMGGGSQQGCMPQNGMGGGSQQGCMPQPLYPSQQDVNQGNQGQQSCPPLSIGYSASQGQNQLMQPCGDRQSPYPGDQGNQGPRRSQNYTYGGPHPNGMGNQMGDCTQNQHGNLCPSSYPGNMAQICSSCTKPVVNMNTIEIGGVELPVSDSFKYFKSSCGGPSAFNGAASSN